MTTIPSERAGRLHLRPGGFPRAIALVAVLTFVPGVARGDFLYGLSGPGFPGGNQLIRIDPSTGVGTAIGPTGTDGVEALEVLDDGRLVGISWDGAGIFSPNELFEINPTTGAATRIGSAGDYLFVEGLAYGGGILYGSADPDIDPIPDHSKVLIRIDPSTGAATEIGAFGPAFVNVEALAYSPSGILYGADIGTDATGPALLTIDPLTGAGTLVATLPTGMLIAGMDFAPDGTLYATTIPERSGTSLPSNLIKIDPATGAMTVIGPVGFQLVQGLAYASTAVPEPGAATLLGLGVVGLIGAGLRRRQPLSTSQIRRATTS